MKALYISLSTLLPSVMALQIARDAAEAIAMLRGRAGNVCGGVANQTQCGGSFPSSFCCTTGTVCTAFDNNNGVICCPSGTNCSTIEPISCDVNEYDVSLNPQNPVHLATLPTSLATCNGNCCPPGYSCVNAICTQVGTTTSSGSGSSSSSSPDSPTSNSPTSIPSSGSPTSSSGTAVPPPPGFTITPTSEPSSSAGGSSGSPPSSDTNTLDSTAACVPFPPVAVVTGFFPGMLAGALLTLLFILCVGKRRTRRLRSTPLTGSDSGSNLGPVRAQVSDPIYVEGSGARTDFLRRNTKARRLNESPSVSESTMSPGLARVRSLFSRTPTMRSTSHQGSPKAHGLGVTGTATGQPTTPRTPQRPMRKEPSMESITIWSPEAHLGRGGGQGQSPGDRTTTFGDVMKAMAAAGSGATPTNEKAPPVPTVPAYLGSPGRVDPRSRGLERGSRVR